jgi:hypothetical protein
VSVHLVEDGDKPARDFGDKFVRVSAKLFGGFFDF